MVPVYPRRTAARNGRAANSTKEWKVMLYVMIREGGLGAARWAYGPVKERFVADALVALAEATPGLDGAWVFEARHDRLAIKGTENDRAPFEAYQLVADIDRGTWK